MDSSNNIWEYDWYSFLYYKIYMKKNSCDQESVDIFNNILLNLKLKRNLAFINILSENFYEFSDLKDKSYKSLIDDVKSPLNVLIRIFDDFIYIFKNNCLFTVDKAPNFTHFPDLEVSDEFSFLSKYIVYEALLPVLEKYPKYDHEYLFLKMLNLPVLVNPIGVSYNSGCPNKNSLRHYWMTFILQFIQKELQLKK